MCDPHWTQVFSALLVPIIALLGIFIACMQWYTAYTKLKFDLFEKRFLVFNVARNFITSIITSGKVKDEELSKFISGIQEAKWVLNNDLHLYFENEIYNQAVDLQVLQKEIEGLQVGEERSSNIHKQREIKNRLSSQFKVLDEKFTPFLRLKSISISWLIKKNRQLT